MSALTNNLQRRLFDAHCHLQFHVERTKKLLEADALSSSSIQGGIGLASTRQEDWSSVAELAAANVFVKPCFGLHPWWVELESSNADILACLMNDLRDRLETNSAAIVGEIGLDRIHCDYKYRDTPRSDSPGPGPFESSTTPDFESGETRDSIKLDAKALQAQLYSSQKELLQAQWNLAGELNRPVVLHCVKAQGDMQAFIRKEAQKEERAVKAAKKIANLGEEKDTMQAISLTSSPPRIYLHAFGGSAETVRQYLAIKPLVSASSQ
jgi:TatD DNase family protein